MKPQKHTVYALALVCAIGVFYVATIRDGHVWGDDHAAYIAHAKNIVEGKPYGDIGYIRSPSSINPAMYPPGFPLLLAPLYHWYGLNLTPMKVTSIGFFCAALFLLYLLIRDYGEGVALSTVASIGICPYFWDFKDMVLSEFPFLASAYAALLTGKLSGKNDFLTRRQVLLGGAVGILAGVAYSIRSVGIVLVPAILLHHFIVTRRISWFPMLCLGMFGLVAIAQKHYFDLESDYLTPLLQVLSVRELLGSPLYYLKCLSVTWDNGYSNAGQMALYLVLSAFATYAVWGRLRVKASPLSTVHPARSKHVPFARFRVFSGQQLQLPWRFIEKLSVVDIFTVFYFLFIILFPWGGRRYLMPILPMFVLYALLGVRDLGIRWTAQWRLALQTGVALAVALTFVAKFSTLPWGEIPGGVQTAGFSEMVDYVGLDKSRSGVIVFFKGRLGALYFGTKVADSYMDADTSKVLDYYREIEASHLIVQWAGDDPADSYLRNLAVRHPQRFVLERETGAFKVFQFSNDRKTPGNAATPGAVR